jgi:acetolactate synthase-1/2/3 large subunit
VFCITGDGSIELNIQELQTLSTYKLPVKIFVINNGGYASMRTWQDTFFDSRYIGSTDDTGAKPLNFSKIANAFGINYEVIKNEEEFWIKIEDISKFEGPMLVEVICDSNEKLQLPMNVDIV